MARLYEYADSNDKSGYFLLDGSEEGNATFQVTSLAERLLDRLDFEPGILNERRGPRLPSQLQWTLFEAGLIYTGGSDPTPAEDFMERVEEDGEKIDLSEEMVAEIEKFIRERGDDRKEVQRLAEMLSIEISDVQNEAIWELSNGGMEGIEDYMREYLKGKLNPNDAPHWSISVNCTQQTFEDFEKGVIEVRIEHVAEESEKYYHVGYFCPEHGFERISTACASRLDWKRRIRLEEHRKNIIDAVINMANDLGFYIGEPTADLDLLTHEEFDVFS